jgi:hypothetical protein
LGLKRECVTVFARLDHAPGQFPDLAKDERRAVKALPKALPPAQELPPISANDQDEIDRDHQLPPADELVVNVDDLEIVFGINAAQLHAHRQIAVREKAALEERDFLAPAAGRTALH